MKKDTALLEKNFTRYVIYYSCTRECSVDIKFIHHSRKTRHSSENMAIESMPFFIEFNTYFNILTKSYPTSSKVPSVYSTNFQTRTAMISHLYQKYTIITFLNTIWNSLERWDKSNLLHIKNILCGNTGLLGIYQMNDFNLKNVSLLSNQYVKCHPYACGGLWKYVYTYMRNKIIGKIKHGLL